MEGTRPMISRAQLGIDQSCEQEENNEVIKADNGQQFKNIRIIKTVSNIIKEECGEKKERSRKENEGEQNITKGEKKKSREEEKKEKRKRDRQ